MQREMKVKVTGSGNVLEEYVNVNYYASFIKLSLPMAPGHGVCSKSVSRAIATKVFIIAAITGTEKFTLIHSILNINFDKVSEACNVGH